MMRFTPRFEQRFVLEPRVESVFVRGVPAMLEGDLKQTVAAHVAGGGMVSVIYIEVQEFYLIAKLFGPEVAEAVADLLEREVGKLVESRLACLPVCVTERLEAGKVLVLAGGMDCSQEELLRTALALRLELRGRVRGEIVKLTGQEPEIKAGAARLITGRPASLEQALASALAEAKRLAMAGPDRTSGGILREFREILELGQVRTVYQPIVNLRAGGVFAWEALARGPKGSHFESPAMLFDCAEEADAVFALEKACRESAIRGFGRPEGGAKLFLNVHPRTLLDPAFTPGETRRLLTKYGLAPHDVVLEITERHSTKDFKVFHRTLAHYRDAGYAVAVDDVGTGYSGLWSIAEIRPDYIKVDMSLIRGIDANPVKRALIETLAAFADKVGCRIIAEGIETEAELTSLLAIGLTYGQGYFLARPGNPRPPVEDAVRGAILACAGRAASGLKCASPVSDLAEAARQVPAGSSVGELKDFFTVNEQVHAVVVVEEDCPKGLIMSHQLDKVLSCQYGPALYLHRDVTRIMDASALTVEWDTSVEVAAQAAMARDRDKLYDPVVVTREGVLCGLVSVQRLLDALASVQMEMAKGANPLTGLPGNVAIEREIARRAAAGVITSFVYADLDNFKVFNDVYGFKDGDKAILLTARILASAIKTGGAPDDFLGHVGGDDFVILCGRESVEAVCRAATAAFDRETPSLYAAEDRERGFIEGRGRDGREGKFPLLSVSLGAFDCTFAVPVTMDELGARAAEVKKFAKSRPGNSWVRDRRAPLGLPPQGEGLPEAG